LELPSFSIACARAGAFPSGLREVVHRRIRELAVLHLPSADDDANDPIVTTRIDGSSLIFEAGYNSGGLRTVKSDLWTGVYNYTWGLEGLLHDSAENRLIAPGVGEQKNGVTQYFHGDWLGSTRALTDAAGAETGPRRYDAFGKQTDFTGALFPSLFGFGGLLGYQTEYFGASGPGLGLQYLEQRYYDPAVGRFLTLDPIGFAGRLNLYGYPAADGLKRSLAEGTLTFTRQSLSRSIRSSACSKSALTCRPDAEETHVRHSRAIP
jgi:RHS repeat-associated protein